MTTYCWKLLELETIKEISNKFYLQSRLSFEDEIVNMDFEIDEFTARNISIAIEDDEKFKYRLSFKYKFDLIKKQYVSILAKTYLDRSEKIAFQCSEDFINVLDSIKRVQDPNELDKLTFLSKKTELAPIKEEVKTITNDTKMKYKIPKLIPVSIFSFVAILIMLSGYFNAPSLNKTNINERVLAESLEIDNDVKEIREEIIIEPLLLEENILFEDFTSNQPLVPFIELEDIVTHNLPKGYVALTFDDGPSQYTSQIVDILKEHEIGGTFFFIGQHLDSYLDHINYVHENGYSIGSHSTNHLNMSSLSSEDQEIEVVQAIDLLREITNSDVNLFRPPFGSYNNHLKDLIIENDYKMILWNNDPQDWKTRNPDKIIESIQNTDVSGSIILLHESQNVIDALPQIIKYLQELNLEIVNLK